MKSGHKVYGKNWQILAKKVAEETGLKLAKKLANKWPKNGRESGIETGQLTCQLTSQDTGKDKNWTINWIRNWPRTKKLAMHIYRQHWQMNWPNTGQEYGCGQKQAKNWQKNTGPCRAKKLDKIGEKLGTKLEMKLAKILAKNQENILGLGWVGLAEELGKNWQRNWPIMWLWNWPKTGRKMPKKVWANKTCQTIGFGFVLQVQDVP